MAKYIIKVEQVEGTMDPEFKEVYGAGIECEGFMIVGKQEDGKNVAIHGLNLLDLASIIKVNKHLNDAARLVVLADKLGFLKGDEDDD